MFEVGFTELLLIFGLALIVLGPEKLPRVASQVGRWLGRARAMARQFREQLEEEVILEEQQAARRRSPPYSPPPASPSSRPEAAPAARAGDTAPPAGQQPAGPDASAEASPSPAMTGGASTSDHERGT